MKQNNYWPNRTILERERAILKIAEREREKIFLKKSEKHSRDFELKVCKSDESL